MPVFQCAICRKEMRFQQREEVPWRPFCSERCKLVDLGRWFDGTYNIYEPLPTAESQISPDELETEP